MTSTAVLTSVALLAASAGLGSGVSDRSRLSASVPAQASTTDRAVEQRVETIREALLRLPYYGVFDFLAFSFDRGAVTLSGYAYEGRLRQDAERAAKRVPGVDEVINKIIDLPVSLNDDEIRWRTFYAIYTNDFLAKYAPGGGLLWGRRGNFAPGWSPRFGAFQGDQPVGSYPIHIVVEGGRIRLLGVVDNQTDKNVANLAARGVSGSFGVENELIVDSQP